MNRVNTDADICVDKRRSVLVSGANLISGYTGRTLQEELTLARFKCNIAVESGLLRIAKVFRNGDGCLLGFAELSAAWVGNDKGISGQIGGVFQLW